MTDLDQAVAESLARQRDSYINEATGIVRAQTAAAEKQISNLNQQLEAKDASIVNRAQEIKQFESDVKTSVDSIAQTLSNLLSPINPASQTAALGIPGVQAGVTIFDPNLSAASSQPIMPARSRVSLLLPLAIAVAAYFILNRNKRR